jgi:hypothetical protein
MYYSLITLSLGPKGAQLKKNKTIKYHCSANLTVGLTTTLFLQHGFGILY